MGLMLRHGQYGDYWGNDFNSSQSLTMDQMKLNAQYIYKFFSNKGFTKNAICAMLGNMQAESALNPGRWQNNNVGHGPAYGIVQWDPFTKYTNWCSGDPSLMDNNLNRVCYEIENGLQWIINRNHPDYPFSFWEFAKSNKPPDYLAMAFLYNYERPADLNQPERGENALFWYNYLVEECTPRPDPPQRVQNTRKWLACRAFRANIRWR